MMTTGGSGGGGGGGGGSGGSSSNQTSNLTSSNNSFLNSSSARNIAIKVNFMKGEEEHCALPVLFAKSSSTLEYCKEVFVNVVYHNKAPQYHDEVKIKLPALLSDNNYHLLFTFYHISCQNSKDQNQLETIIGYSWLPLQQQFQFETTIHFANPQTSSQILNPNNNANNSMQMSNFVTSSQVNNSDFINASFQINTNDLNLNQANNSNSTTTTNRCSMIKSGIYSLPISFEKLPSGYSNLNYSIYDNSLSSTGSTNNCSNK